MSSEAIEETLPDQLQPQGDTYAYVAMPGVTANAFAYLTTLVDEFKLTIEETETGWQLRSTHVDPDNVAMAHITLQLDSDLGVYQADITDGFTTGIKGDWLRGRFKWARVGRGGLETGDDVHLLLDKGARKAKTQVEREVVRTSTQMTIDPDSVRQEPDILELDLPCYAHEVSPLQLYQAVQAAREESEHARVSGQVRKLEGTAGSVQADLTIEGQGDTADEHVAIPGVADPNGPIEETSSLFSIDYLWSMVKALKRAKMEHITINWGAEFPVSIEFQHSDLGIEGQFMLAPRIQAD